MAVFFEKEQHVLIQPDNDDDWQAFSNTCEGFITEGDFRRIHSYLNGVAKTIVIEKGYVDADYRDTCFNFFSRKFAQYPSKTIRANFLAALSIGDLRKSPPDYIFMRQSRCSNKPVAPW